MSESPASSSSAPRALAAASDVGSEVDFQCVELTGDFSDATMQRARWIVPVRQPVVLISQVQRSGGHLLARLFDGHPACISHPHELNWGGRKGEWPSFDVGVDTPAAALFPLVCEVWQDAAVSVGGMRSGALGSMPDAEGRVMLYPFSFDVRLRESLFAALLATATLSSRRHLLDAYLTASFNAWLDYRGLYAAPKQYVTAFSPRVTMTPGSLERFFADYPDGHLVTIVRHPGSWLASALRSPSLGREHAGDSRAALRIWSASTEASLQAAAQFDDRVTIVLFDDLVHRTHDALAGLCVRLGLAFHPCLVGPTFNGMPILSNSLHAPVAGLDSTATDRHRLVLSAEQASAVDDAALPLYESVVSRHGLGGT